MKIFISVGDPSAELHAFKVAEKLKASGFYIASIGGEKLKSISDDFIADTISFEIFGFSLSIFSLVGLYHVFLKAKKYLYSQKPDAVLLVDFYGFNIKLARLSRIQNIRVYYYIPPQIWASRYGRIKNIKKYVDKVFITLPFEKKIYEKENIDAIYVGNPLLETINSAPVVSSRFNQLYEKRKINIGLFPGSRSYIIKRHIPILNEVTKIIEDKIGVERVKFYLFGFKKMKEAYSNANKSIQIIFENDQTVKKSDMDLAVSVSGTIATEIALLNIPAVIFYRVSWLNAFVVNRIITTKYVSLPNILLEEEIFPEYLQKDASPHNIANKVIQYIQNPELLESIKLKLKKINEILTPSDASRRVAEVINSELQNSKSQTL